MSDVPMVSVVVPCLNRAHFLRPTIDSILEQDYPALECIVVDGGSTDGTVDLLRTYGSRVRWVSEPDKGHANAINKGWRMSRGQILAWLNADDVYATRDAARLASAYLASHPEACVVYGRCGAIDGDGRQIGMSHFHEFDLAYSVLTCDHCIPQPAAFIRRDALEKVGWLDEDFYQKKDHELWLRLAAVGDLCAIPEMLAHARHHSGNLGYQGDSSADACVQLTEKFLSSASAPAELRARRSEALSNAHLHGLLYAWGNGHHLRKTVSFLARAILLYPPNTFHALRRTASVVLSDLFGVEMRGGKIRSARN